MSIVRLCFGIKVVLRGYVSIQKNTGRRLLGLIRVSTSICSTNTFKKRLSFWGEGLFSNYNVNGLGGKVTLFNTSHLYNNNISGYKKHYELHETDLFLGY